MNSLIEYDYKMHGGAQINQYEILNLFVIEYIQVSLNIIFNYIRITHIMSFVQYKYQNKRVIIHMIIIIERLC